MKGLMKSAASLPRFALDCGFWRTRRYAGASPAVVGLQTAAVSYCHEHGSDGWIPDDGLATSLGFKEREVAKLVPEMLRRNIWRPASDGGFEVVGYLDHNPSRAQVRDDRQKRSEAGVKGNHDRWHENRIVVGCPFCPTQGSQVRSEPESDSDPTRESQEKTREDETREEGIGSPIPMLPAPNFEPFWSSYPPRDGKRLNRAKAEGYWRKLTDAERDAAVLGARNLARAIEAGGKFGPPDADRWLRDRKWTEWQEPAVVGSNGNGHARAPFARDPNGPAA